MTMDSWNKNDNKAQFENYLSAIFIIETRVQDYTFSFPPKHFWDITNRHEHVTKSNQLSLSDMQILLLSVFVVQLLSYPIENGSIMHTQYCRFKMRKVE